MLPHDLAAMHIIGDHDGVLHPSNLPQAFPYMSGLVHRVIGVLTSMCKAVCCEHDFLAIRGVQGHHSLCIFFRPHHK